MKEGLSEEFAKEIGQTELINQQIQMQRVQNLKHQTWRVKMSHEGESHYNEFHVFEAFINIKELLIIRGT